MVNRKLSSMQRTLCMFYVCLSASILPVTSDTTYSFRLQEELPAGTFVGTVNVQQGHISGNSARFFSVSRSGDITTTLRVDRESLSSNPIVFEVRSSSSTVTVHIHVDDINDNIPEFPTPVLPLRIFENNQVNSEYSIDLATDGDASENGTVDYAIISGNEDGKFRLGRNATECSTTGFPLCIVTEDSLDRENVSFYQLNISASDRGKPSQRSFCLVNITIVDLNDNSPVFSKSKYSVSVNENNPVGVQILAVTATDKDQGVNGKIEYSFQNDPGSSKFQVNTSSGVISTRTPLDYDVPGQRSYSFKVYARDRPGKPNFRQATADVLVNILDVNDNIPQLRVIYNQGKSPAEVSENAVNGTVIATVFINDGDDSSGPNGQVYVEIANGNGTFALVFLAMTQTGFIYQLKTATLLDRERIAFHNITITARDGGSPSLNSTVNVLLSVKDVNDEVPTFSKPRYTASVSEQAQNGSSVLRVVAHDSDTGSNAQISYSIISGNEMHWFGIDSASGLITTENSIDREALPQVTLTVLAQDHGLPSLNSTALVIVSVRDINDNAPRFNQSNFNATLPENMEPGAIVITLQATDDDDGANGNVTYMIDSRSHVLLDTFSIGATSGILSTKVRLDREGRSFYDIPVIASDHGVVQRSSRALVHLFVTDVNDNYPIFYPVTYIESILSNSKPGNLTQITATDADEGSNGQIIYSIIKGDEGKFDIDSSSGVLRTLSSLDSKVKGFYKLIIAAHDMGGKFAQQNASVEVSVQGQSDNPPQFKYAVYNFSVYENVAQRTYIGRVVATSKDNNASMRYTIVSGDPGQLFSVDSVRGIIMVHGKLDRETKDKYSLNVIAQVGNVRPLSATTTVFIDILDSNDNSPQFSPTSEEVIIDASWPAGKQIYVATAFDKDAGLNGIVHYQLTDDGNGLCKVNTTSGAIFLARRVTSIDDSQLVLSMLASDLGSPPLYAVFMLRVVIVSNNPPRFLASSFTVNIPRDVPIGKQILPVTALDPDSGTNGMVAYTITPTGNEEGLFGISKKGILLVNKNLDLASLLHSLTVTATDKGETPLTSSTSVTVRIQDSISYQAIFKNQTFVFSVMENQLPGSIVCRLIPISSDSSRRDKVVYSLIDDRGAFMIDSSSGVISSSKQFDREALIAQSGHSTVTLLAKATTSDIPHKQDTAMVLIRVQDQNDNVPYFRRSVVFVTVKESSQVGSMIYKVSASDPDEGDNAAFTFSIVSKPRIEVFWINSVSGYLFLNQSLDREKVDHYVLTVQATDVNNSSMYSQVNIEIVVADANDNYPVFTTRHLTVSASENLPVSSQIAVVHAEDKDQGVNAEIAYTITGGNWEAVFDINHLTGEIILKKPLDFERTKRYSLNISADDRGNPALSTVSWLTVNVIDENDRPVFSDHPTVFTIRENATVGSEIGQCLATDEDTGMNGQIKFSLDSQTPLEEAAFEVNPGNCVITTRRKLDREIAPMYKLVIRAMDSGTPEYAQRSAYKEITILLQDVNDNKPRFVTPPSVAVLSDVTANSLVTAIRAMDPDEGTNSQIIYNLKGGDTNLFQLDTNKGALTTSAQLPSGRLRFQLMLSARDGGIPNQIAETNVTIFKKGQPNNGPTFTHAVYKGSVEENNSPGTSVTQVAASFSPNSVIRYYVTADSSNGSFVLNENSGLITAAFELDRESSPISFFTLTVYAVDLSGRSPRTSNCTVEITLLDKNDNPPIFQQNVYRSTVMETLPAGERVCVVTALDKDIGQNAEVEYSILTGNIDGAFQVNISTGVITTLKTLNRTQISNYTLTVSASDKGLPSRKSNCLVTITVLDSNNHLPQFSRPYYALNVVEGTAIGTILGEVTATDDDHGENAQITYNIAGDHPSDEFRINPFSGNLKVARKLDRETVEVYILNISASDHGTPPLSSFVEVYLNVLDKNDNRPLFSQSVYTVSISEAAALQSSIATVLATDKDFGTNALITYTILSGNSDRTFSIYPNGTIYNLKTFDRERKSSYFLTVMARDKAEPVMRQLSSTTVVQLTITDINDNSPYFISSNVTHVSEHAKTGDAVMKIMVADLDEGSNSLISFSLGNFGSATPFTLGSTDGVLRVSGSLDRELRSSYELKVTASDQGIPPKNAEMKLTVIVDDFNDHAPVFQRRTNTVTIKEDILIGSEVARFYATDADQGRNAEVRYSIAAGNANGTFEMDPLAGVISTIKSLDRETIPDYTLLIRASDLGIPELHSEETLKIILSDVNDNAPTFPRASYSANVYENQVKANVITVVAADDDEGSDGLVSYQIIYGNEEGVFTMDSKGGQIGARVALDRETQAEYFLRIRAKDGGTPPLVGETDVTIKVTDVNDNSPIFQPNVLKAAVKENLPAGAPVAQVSATDVDHGSNARITYSLLVTLDLFTIDPNTGEITTTVSLDREKTPSYELVILAVDGGIPRREGNATLFIAVEDANDFDPVFAFKQYSATVAQGAPPGTFIIMASAKDNDIGPNAESVYTVSGLPPVFQIAPRSGIITVAETVPMNRSSYSFTVKATNVNAAQRFDTTTVRITAAPGSYPVFQHFDLNLTVSEAATLGTKLVTVNATGHTSYFIAAGNVGEVFEIDKVNGELKIVKHLDYESRSSYRVVIGARDGSVQSLASFVVLHIAVIDVNDNAPVFNQSVYLVDIQEDLRFNSTVMWLYANDRDSGPNAEMEFKMVSERSPASSAFHVSLTSGRVYTKIKLDRENTSSYSFKVRVEDVSDRSMASEAVVIVNVQDINDNIPVFVPPLSGSLHENVSRGYQIAVLMATDADAQNDAQLRFGFAVGGNPGDMFNLDARSGNLTLKRTLNREDKSQYVLRVTVDDSLHTTVSNFTVTVLDVNDNPPRFLSNPITQKITEKLPVQTVVLNLTALDDDVGANAEILYFILPSPSSDFFKVDRQTGALRLEKMLTYKKPRLSSNGNQYNITVKAWNPYAPFYETTADVIIEVTDANDHAPIFLSPRFDFFVLVTARINESVGRAEAVDEQDDGLNAFVIYEKLVGNGSLLFNIEQDSGNVTVAGSLDTPGLFYLQVRARDLGHPVMESKADVYVEVIEPNNHSPIFGLNQYRKNVFESLAVGREVIQVTASDQDSGKNGQVFYHVERSDPPGYLGIGRQSGSIYVEKPLDYETARLIKLNVLATDGGRKPRSSSVEVRIELLDVNDNHPVFTKREYDGYIAENTAQGTAVITVTAVDPDQLERGRVEYGIIGVDVLEFFEINKTSGEITSKVSFDYEVRQLYEVIISAKDHGNPQLYSQPNAKVLVHVTSVNEYVPRFNQSLFTASVAENAPVGQPVTRIAASDKDKGPDGEMVFVLVGDSNNKGFSLDSSSGVLSVSGRLDSERAGIVTLQVVVKNALQNIVTPDTSDFARIIITVTDANEAPYFIQKVYNSRVKEDSLPGTFVQKVTAIDDDSAKHPVTSKITYGISTGNIGNAFAIDADTGVISTLAKLDRESVAQYHLTITASDQGLPPLSGNGTINVILEDVNDNAPRLFANCSGYVRENQPGGTLVMKLQPYDPDVDPNRGPFTFSITGTDFGKFLLDNGSGEITTTVRLDREAASSYNLSVRISDDGSPPQSAVSFCSILVEDENDNRPRPAKRVVHVNTNGSFGAGFIADVKPEDPDADDNLVCQIIKNSYDLFSFPPRSCFLTTNRRFNGSAKLDLRVNGSDGRWAVSYDVEVRFVTFNSKTIDNSITVRLQNTSPTAFLLQSYQLFLNAVDRVLLQRNTYEAQLFSIKSSGSGLLDLLVAARNQRFDYMIREDLSAALSKNKSALERNSKVEIQTVDYTPCSASNPCQNGGECTSYIHTLGTKSYEAQPVIFLSLDYEWRFSCLCKPDFAGEKCELSKQGCVSKPCKNGATCIEKGSSFVCQCPTGFRGPTCADDVDECLQGPCKNGGTCKNIVGDYQCNCLPGYLGKSCSSGFDFCRVASPTKWAQPKCTCASSQACPCACVGFESAAFLQFPTLKSLQRGAFNNITIEFSTAKKNGLLLYNNDGQYDKHSDFIAIQIINGRVRMSFYLGDTASAVIVEAPNFVADGQWHRVTAVRDKKVGKVSVDSSSPVTNSSPGNLLKLNLGSSPLYVGGIKDFEQAVNHTGKHIQTDDFLGCMRNVFINGKKLELSSSTDSAGIRDRCPRLGQCLAGQCKNGGTCLDYWFDYICQCAEGFSGRNCEQGVKPVKFGTNSFLVLQFTERYRREQQRKDQQGTPARKRRASSPSSEKFSIRFRTRRDGLLLLAMDSAMISDSGYTALEIKSGNIKYSFRKGGNTASFTVSAPVTDGEWHNVSLLHQRKSVTVTLDGEATIKEFETAIHDILGKNIKSWHLGGVNSSLSEFNLQKFIGCMENLEINGQHISFSGPNSFAVISSHGGQVEEGCDGSGSCALAQCSNLSIPYCFEEWENYVCISDAQCRPKPCKNNATCLPQKDGSFKCNCVGDFRGETCAIPGVCWPHPCGDKDCRLGDSGSYRCVEAGEPSPAVDGSLSPGVIAAIIFFAVLLVLIVAAVIIARRVRRRRGTSDKAPLEYDANKAAEVASDLHDVSQKISPCHSSDDSGVVIRNPSQKSLTELRHATLQNGRDIVIHNVGAPEDYQIKLTKTSREKIDLGFSESDGEFIMHNDSVLTRDTPGIITDVARYSRTPNRRSTPLENEASRHTANKGAKSRGYQFPNPQFRHNLDKRQPLSRSVLDPRLRGPTKSSSSRRFRKGSLGSSSSDEAPDFSDTGHRSDENNSERLEHYDIEVASLGYSEVSYQYDPNTFRDHSLNLREPPGLSAAEIERLRRQTPSGSLLDAVSSISGEGAPTIDKLSSVLEVPDTSSESSDDTFTCSEFEYDNDELSREENDRGSMVFSKLAGGETMLSENNLSDRTELEGRASRLGSLSTLNFSDDEIIPTAFSNKPMNGSKGVFNWDDVLNWGLRYHNLRGVYKDIAQLKDSSNPTLSNDGEYV